jgi:hypothetical protein
MFANTFNVHADFIRKSFDYATECVLFPENRNVNRCCVRVCHRRNEHHPTIVESGQKRAIGSANIHLGIHVERVFIHSCEIIATDSIEIIDNRTTGFEISGDEGQETHNVLLFVNLPREQFLSINTIHVFRYR